ncbi:MAG: sulfotransferase [Cytophagales bacterium]|nr:sulfotransferase [Cytophagales bacterium]
MRFNAIQFIGTQRSGSNLLRLMLDSHADISAPHPPHLLKTFYPLLSYYGDFQRLDNRTSLVNDMCDWVDANPVPWEGVALDRNKIVASTSSIIDIFRQLYEARMQHDGANIWCCKSTFNINYVADMESAIRPFYIYLYRDGRDVATSFKKAIVGPKHVYHLAQKWADEQKAVRDFLVGVSPERYMVLAYEDLLIKPETCIQQICDKLGITYDPKMLQFYISNESRRTADSGEMWKNVLNPVMKDNTGKYLKELSETEIALFESVAGVALKELGYSKVSGKSVAYESDIPSFEIQNQQLQEAARSNASDQDKEKRAGQKLLLKQIKSRLGIVEQQPNLA